MALPHNTKPRWLNGLQYWITGKPDHWQFTIFNPQKSTLATLGDFPDVLKANDAAIKRIKLLTHFITIAGLELDRGDL